MFIKDVREVRVRSFPFRKPHPAFWKKKILRTTILWSSSLQALMTVLLLELICKWFACVSCWCASLCVCVCLCPPLSLGADVQRILQANRSRVPTGVLQSTTCQNLLLPRGWHYCSHWASFWWCVSCPMHVSISTWPMSIEHFYQIYQFWWQLLALTSYPLPCVHLSSDQPETLTSQLKFIAFV